MKKFFTLLIITMSLLSFIRVKAAVREAYNISTSPSEDLATSVNITWHSDIVDSFVEYTLVNDTSYSNKTTILGTCKSFKKEANEGGFLSEGFNERYTCYAEIKNLTPASHYMYRIGKTTFSSNAFFNTAVNTNAFSFLHITDPQYGNATQASHFNALMTRAYTINPNIGFTMFTGDIVDRGGKEVYWNYFYQQSNIAKTVIATVPGNHEYYDASGSPKTWDASYYNAYFHNPQNGPSAIMNSSYFFRYNNALFIMIDSENKNQGANTAWFKDVMDANIDADFVVVGMHRSFYGSIYASDSVAVRALWQQLFDRYGVDLVLSGHDHIYARSHSIFNDTISSDPIRGTTYIIGGFGGEKSYGASPNPKYAKIIEQTRCANIITINNNNLLINLINSSGETIDTAIIQKKRLGTPTANFDKESFLNSIVGEVNQSNKTKATISWSSSAFKNVASIQVINNKYNSVIAETHLYHQSFTSLTISGILKKVLNEYTVRIKFADGTVAEVIYVVDNREVEPVEKITIIKALEMIQNELKVQLSKVFK